MSEFSQFETRTRTTGVAPGAKTPAPPNMSNNAVLSGYREFLSVRPSTVAFGSSARSSILGGEAEYNRFGVVSKHGGGGGVGDGDGAHGYGLGLGQPVHGSCAPPPPPPHPPLRDLPQPTR